MTFISPLQSTVDRTLISGLANACLHGRVTRHLGTYVPNTGIACSLRVELVADEGAGSFYSRIGRPSLPSLSGEPWADSMWSDSRGYPTADNAYDGRVTQFTVPVRLSGEFYYVREKTTGFRKSWNA
ncbi:hypothetical protein R1flu_014518 [Riccia fluitans]|uniref:Uncharacterized protein n=1 Tax=Riccia fluitans TaxID=41844 RepID=A0ABD1YJF5_9MARC